MTKITLTLLITAVLLSGGCHDSTDAGPTPPEADVSSNAQEVVDGLCDVLADARSGDVAKAKKQFDHGPLHTLAQAATSANRTVAAALLTAKEAVEEDLAAGGDTAGLDGDLETLIAATAEGYKTVGVTVTDCSKEQ